MTNKKNDAAALKAKPDTPAVPALIVFGRFNGSRIDQGAWFWETQADAAKAAASDAGLKAFAISDDEHRQAAEGLQQGLVSPDGDLRLSPISKPLLAKLDHMANQPSADPAGALTPVEPAPHPADGASQQAGEAAGPEKAPASTPTATPASETAQGSNLAAPLPPSDPAGAPTVTAALWESLKAGDMVLAVSADDNDKYAGWWEAKVVRVTGKEVVVHWLGAPATEPQVRLHRRYVALLHPDYIKEL